MKDGTINRRQFVHTAALTTAAASLFNFVDAHAAEKSKDVHWPIGCMNRPWSKWTHDAGFNGIKAAGYTLLGLISRSKDDPFIGSDATPEYLDNLRNKIAAL